MINTIFSTVTQVLMFSAIPFFVYLIKKRQVKGFWDYIGLKKSTRRANMLAFLVVLILVVPMLFLTFTNQEFKEIMINPKSVAGEIRQMGFGLEAIATILIMAVLKTSLSEEIFFRGFLAKRLIAVTNFQVGNTLQAILFGAIHTLLFMSITENVYFLTVIFIFPAMGAYFKTYLNERLANGSIIPGWIAYASANIIAYSAIAFIL